MAKKKKVVVTTSKGKKLNPTTSKITSSSTSKPSESKPSMLFHKKNYMWSLAGLGLIALGLLLMSGGNMPDENTWDPNLIYSFRRITLAPIVILTGLAFQIVAIFKK